MNSNDIFEEAKALRTRKEETAAREEREKRNIQKSKCNNYNKFTLEIVNEVQVKFGDTFDVFCKEAPTDVIRRYYNSSSVPNAVSYREVTWYRYNVICLSHKGSDSSDRIDHDGWLGFNYIYLKIMVFPGPKPSAVVWHNVKNHPGYIAKSYDNDYEASYMISASDNEFVFDDAKMLCSHLKEPLIECVVENGEKYEKSLSNEKTKKSNLGFFWGGIILSVVLGAIYAFYALNFS